MNKKELIEMGYDLIPVSDLEISIDSNKTVGYDLTVDDNYTFATHDGVFIQDTMAVFLPLSNEAQQEAKEKMIKSTTTASINSPNFSLSKEMLTGLFTLTTRESGTEKTINKPEEATKLDIDQKVKIKWKGGVQKTTAGRVIFNTVLPANYPYVNEEVDKKAVNKILSKIMSVDRNLFVETLDKLMKLSFYYGTIYSKSFAISMLKLSPELLKLKDELSEAKDPSSQSDIIKKMEKSLLDHMKNEIPDLYDQVKSGGAKGTGQIRQIMVCKGLIADPMGNILPPIISSIGDGYAPTEYFDASAGSRKGTIDRSLNTAKGGYSYRKMVYIAGNVELNQTTKNCRTKKGLEIVLTPEIYKKMQGRYVIKDGDEIELINEKMIGQKVSIRSPIFCKTEKICPICYGELYKQNASKNIGVTAAQNFNVSEKIMKSSLGILTLEDDACYSFDDLWEETEWCEN